MAKRKLGLVGDCVLLSLPSLISVGDFLFSGQYFFLIRQVHSILFFDRDRDIYNLHLKTGNRSVLKVFDYSSDILDNHPRGLSD